MSPTLSPLHPLLQKEQALCQHKAQTSCATSGAHRLLQPWLNPKKQLHCRKAELTFLIPKGGAAASEAATALGEQQAGTGWMQSHGLGLGRKTGCNWKGQFIRETSHCREVTTHWKGSRPAEGGQSCAAAQICIPQPQKPSRCHRGKRLPGTQLMFYKQPERRASSKVPKKSLPGRQQLKQKWFKMFKSSVFLAAA